MGSSGHSEPEAPTVDLAVIQAAFPELDIAGRLGEGTYKIAFRATRAGGEVVLKVLKQPLAVEPDAEDGDEADIVAVMESGSVNSALAASANPLPEVAPSPVPTGDAQPSLPPRVQREIEAMRRVRSRRVVTILDGPALRDIAGNMHWWYIEPFYSGGTLEQRIARGPMEAEEATALCDALLEGVDDLWTQVGLVHRDIKPANVVYDSAGEPVLLDLGIVLDTAATPLTDPARFGPRTNRYCAPEQLVIRSMADLDARTDEFMIGVSVYEAYAGSHPFAPFDRAFLSRVASGQFDQAVLERRPGGNRLKQVLARLLRPKQHERFRLPSLARAALRGEDM
jgi:serine/threonine-protein kinase